MKKLFLLLVLCFFNTALFAQSSDFVSDKLSDIEDYRGIFDCTVKAEKEEFDLRSCDLSNTDLSMLPRSVLNKLTFDDKTIWPPKKKMPSWLNVKKIMRDGKTPGLKIRELHKQRITGKGVSIAIIDQTLSQNAEYIDVLAHYKNLSPYTSGSMHGAAVASIAVGKNVGVAPEAKLYFIAKKDKPADYSPYAEALSYVLSLNKTLPKNGKISVVSISRGFSNKDESFKKFFDEVEKAKKQGIYVITTNGVFTASKNGYYADADDSSSFTKPAYWLEDLSSYEDNDEILLPSEYRITASPTGENDYVAYYKGGLSWAVPYAAGLFCLAKQIAPDITGEEFEKTAKETSDTVVLKDTKGNSVRAKNFVNPQNLIKEIMLKKSDKNKREQMLKENLKTSLKK